MDGRHRVGRQKRKGEIMSMYIPVQVGIYNTWAKLTEHHNGDVTLHQPTIKWVNNTGSLFFTKRRLTGSDAAIAKDVFVGDAWIENEEGEGRCLSYGEWVSRFNQ